MFGDQIGVKPNQGSWTSKRRYQKSRPLVRHNNKRLHGAIQWRGSFFCFQFFSKNCFPLHFSRIENEMGLHVRSVEALAKMQVGEIFEAFRNFFSYNQPAKRLRNLKVDWVSDSPIKPQKLFWFRKLKKKIIFVLFLSFSTKTSCPILSIRCL